MRIPIVGGNWKMNTTRAEALPLLVALRDGLDGFDGAEVVVMPPAPWLGDAANVLEEDSAVHIGVQNVHWEPRGAFTGEQSAAMLVGTAEYALVGHSERRHVFGESDADVNRKLRSILDAGLRPILAVGETEAERDTGATYEVLRRQLEGAFAGFTDLPTTIVIAYEPVWAIGTGRTATPEAAQEACAAVRSMVAERFGAEAASALRIQYGGSVTADNIAALAVQPDIDGALVGGASLNPEAFIAICRAIAQARHA
ncbi:MAG: triose-phosphate isomerase [Dehalococcoidia bacterium]|nr:triose-phosphate isomerase [Dehalococcoidia bacterium]